MTNDSAPLREGIEGYEGYSELWVVSRGNIQATYYNRLS